MAFTQMFMWLSTSNWCSSCNISVFLILLVSGAVLLPVLLPVAITDKGVKSNSSTTSNGTFSELDKLSMGNITQKSPRLWAFFLCTYWISCVSLVILWWAYKHVAYLRSEALKAPEVKPEQFAVVVRDIPPPPEGQTRKQQVDSYFKNIYPETYYRSMIVTDNTEVFCLFHCPLFRDSCPWFTIRLKYTFVPLCLHQVSI